MRAGFRQCVGMSAGAALMMMSSMMIAAHGATVNPPDPAQPQAAGESGQPTLQMVMARAELKDSINAKKAKQGDTIRARIKDNVELANGHQLAKDTILEGHVDQVQASDHKSDSTVVVTFDKALVKGGEELPIKATLLSIWEPQEGVSGGMSPQAAMPQGGGPMQSGVSVSGTAETSHIPMSMDVPQAGMPQGSQKVPGVTLHSDIHEKSSATFTASRRNVDVPDGTQMKFELVVIPAGVQLH
jgi:hypothetical protein